MKIMTFLLIAFMSLYCNQNSIDKNIDTLGFSDNSLKEQFTINSEKLNVRIHFEEKEVLNTIIEIDSKQLDDYKKVILVLSKHITPDSTNFYLKKREETFFLKNDDYTKKCLLKLDQNIQLTKKINDAIKLKVSLVIEEKKFDEALKLAEMSVYLRHPFYFGVLKDDRYLKIFSQKELFKLGNQKEAINNLLKLN